MFLPRALTKGNKNQLKAPPRVTHAIPRSEITDNAEAASKPEGSTTRLAKGKATDAALNEDHACTVLLALSEYALWSDAEWAGELEFGKGGRYGSTDDTGYVPLSRVFERSGLSLPAGDEISVVRALRHHCADALELRMIVADPSSSSGTGGYEVRRREAPARRYSPDDWDARTVYIENIPPQFRTITGVHRLTAACLGGPLTRLVHISFPTNHPERAGAPPKCRGYALVTLHDPSDVARLLEAYPWQGRPADSDTEATDARSEAARFGLRTLSKARWDELQAEYQARKARVMQEIAAYEDAQLSGMVHGSRGRAGPSPPEDAAPQPESASSTVPYLDSSSLYPYGCLVFVRGVHIETNKTTLKALFGRAVAGEGIDYVDYAKGMDSCHLRLATPAHAERLHAYFDSRKLSQASGLDDEGKEGAQVVAISTEIVRGRREELYWEKVPSKVRAQAVAKALGSPDASNVQSEGPRPKKRRKK
ncbi:hypothetical protein HDZ31DRAFT_44742 [Schizophyllum fasciatum]